MIQTLCNLKDCAWKRSKSTSEESELSLSAMASHIHVTEPSSCSVLMSHFYNKIPTLIKCAIPGMACTFLTFGNTQNRFSIYLKNSHTTLQSGFCCFENSNSISFYSKPRSRVPRLA